MKTDGEDGVRTQVRLQREEFWRGFQDILPFMLGVVPFGLVAGLGAVNVGFPTWLAIAKSAAVFAGAAQLAAIRLLEVGSGMAVIWLTVVFVNMRHLMYSATLAPHWRTINRRWRLLLPFLMTDQSFAFSLLRYQGNPRLSDGQKIWYYLGISLPLAVVWVGTAVVGALLGVGIPDSWSLDFVIPLAFLSLIVPHLRQKTNLAAGVAAAIVAVYFSGLPFNLGLLVAIGAGLLTGRAAEHFWPAAEGA